MFCCIIQLYVIAFLNKMRLKSFFVSEIIDVVLVNPIANKKEFEGDYCGKAHQQCWCTEMDPISFIEAVLS